MKATDKISTQLIKWVQGRSLDITIPNIFIGAYEMDMMCIKQSGYTYEYEIKVSRADYMNDFKKCSQGKLKHDQLSHGELAANRFFFVVPEGLIKLEEVPAYCGLMYWYENATNHDAMFKIIRNAKMLHKNKFDNYSSLTWKLAHREHNARFDRDRYKQRLDKIESNI